MWDGGDRESASSSYASYKRQKRNENVTEITSVPDRGHALTIDHGWREVAQISLDFIGRFLRP